MKQHGTFGLVGFVACAMIIGLGTMVAASANDTAAGPEVASPEFEQLYSRGKGGFMSNCSSCHGSDGQGESGPSLVDNPLLSQTGEISRTVIHGFSYMPPFGDVLGDEQVAAILTYVRNSWGNEYGVVTTEDVSEFR